MLPHQAHPTLHEQGIAGLVVAAVRTVAAVAETAVGFGVGTPQAEKTAGRRRVPRNRGETRYVRSQGGSKKQQRSSAEIPAACLAAAAVDSVVVVVAAAVEPLARYCVVC